MGRTLFIEYLHYPNLSIKHIQEAIGHEYVQTELQIAISKIEILVEQWNDYSRLIPDEPETGTELYYSNKYSWITLNSATLQESLLKLL
ncbi:hypothetical protein A0128_20475 [Leptospira tipperaryensis]|uniref:Uncharacterized protein n=1 Tax=Leptospira tipperaryensis TaxID=2564040 RepID=A0A1D7V3J0_9LEPT|nr:hypothetical protein A0128_20475 [Leptospira tipperaryensis]